MSQNHLFSNTNYLEELNPTQRKAVENLDGPTMIIAGPGSGKTRVLTYRIAHLIHSGRMPYNILALTFTNKAAREMKERIQQIVGVESAARLYMGTFHSIFARILRFEAEQIGYPSNFSIYDSSDTKSLIKTIVNEQNLNTDLYKPGMVYNRISNAKNNLLSPSEYRKSARIVEDDELNRRPQMGKLYQIYAQRCKQAGAMDFDDLLYQMYQLLIRNPSVLNKYQHRFQYLLIDEFQDTNYAQYSVVKLLGARLKNICVVGDDAQSIYAFRGATIKNILNFEKDYPDLKVFKLEQNYRSTKAIVEMANKVIVNNTEQLAKEIWTGNEEGKKVVFLKAASDGDEGKQVAEAIVASRLRDKFANSDYAVLYRTNAQSRILEESLRRRDIPYKVYGGLSFFQRKEIKDLMAYLRMVVNSYDEEALRRVINYPTRGIGKTTMDKIAKAADNQEVALWDILNTIDTVPRLMTRAKTAITNFVKMIQGFKDLSSKINAYELARHIGSETSLLHDLHSDKSVEGLNRYENTQELFNSIKAFVDSNEAREEASQNEQEEVSTTNDLIDENPLESLSLDSSLGSYLQEVSLLTDFDSEDNDGNHVKLMTIHAAKGLEFECVYLVGMEENLFPGAMASKSIKDIEEERRLFYVAVTRAKKQLMLSSAKCRYRYGDLKYNETSRFVEEIPRSLLDVKGERSFSKRVQPRSSYENFKNSFVKSNVNSFKKQRAGSSAGPSFQPPANFKPSDVKLLDIGTKVIHQRFGEGKVLSFDGRGDKKLALIDFKLVGEKRLLLRFAKLMLVD